MQGIGAEALIAAVRRSAVPVIIAIVTGAVAMVILQQLAGAQYSASARVLVPEAPISKVITGTSAYVDPATQQQTEIELANAPQVFDRAAAATQNHYGSADVVRSASSISGQPGDILAFSATAKTPDAAVGIANAVARGYIAWHASLTADAVDKSIADLTTRLRSLPAGDASRSDLQGELTKLAVLKTLSSADTLLVQPAASATKTRPAPIHDALLGAALGLLLGLLISALREAIDTKVRSERDVEDELSVPVLASVRSLPRRVRMVMYGRYERLFADTYALLAAQITQAAQRNQTNGLPQGTLIALTSALAREGKTTTTCNIAVALARRGAHVLLLDFDLRKPEVARTFGLPGAAPGVVEVIEGKIHLEDALWTITLDGARPVAVHGSGVRQQARSGPSARAAATATATATGGAIANGTLDVLPAGSAMKVQMLSDAPQVGALLEELRARYDFVVIDTPPALLTVEMADLGQHLDFVILVVRQGKASASSLRTLSRRAHKWQAELLGAILTDATSQQSYGSYYQ